jgi:hypothetical protein
MALFIYKVYVIVHGNTRNLHLYINWRPNLTHRMYLSLVVTDENALAESPMKSCRALTSIPPCVFAALKSHAKSLGFTILHYGRPLNIGDGNNDKMMQLQQRLLTAPSPNRHDQHVIVTRHNGLPVMSFDYFVTTQCK